MNANEIMTVEEVAGLFRVSERTVYDWAKKGEIPCGKLGSIWRFKRGDIIRWANKNLGSESEENYFAAPISIGKVLSPDRIKFLDSTHKFDAMQELLELIKTSPLVGDSDILQKSIFHREELMSTGIGLGIGIPHVRIPSVQDIVMAVGICNHELPDYESIDKIPVKLIFMIVANESQHAQHLKLLSHITSIFKNSEITEKLLKTKSTDQFYKLLIKKH